MAGVGDNDGRAGMTEGGTRTTLSMLTEISPISIFRTYLLSEVQYLQCLRRQLKTGSTVELVRSS